MTFANKFMTLFLASGVVLSTACSEAEPQQEEETTQIERINTAAAPEEIEADTAVAEAEKKITYTPKEAFARQYPGAAKVKWSTDENGYQEASFVMDNEKYRADYTNEGEWVETESSIDYEILPMAAKKVVEENYNKEEITEVERVQHPKKGVFYDVEFKRDGKNFDLEVKENGEVIKD